MRADCYIGFNVYIVADVTDSGDDLYEFYITLRDNNCFFEGEIDMGLPDFIHLVKLDARMRAEQAAQFIPVIGSSDLSAT